MNLNNKHKIDNQFSVKKVKTIIEYYNTPLNSFDI